MLPHDVGGGGVVDGVHEGGLVHGAGRINLNCCNGNTLLNNIDVQNTHVKCHFSACVWYYLYRY